jgi:hypothetical protein
VHSRSLLVVRARRSVVGIRVAESVDEHSDPDSQDQSQREGDSVMFVELQFGQQVGAGDAQKGPGAEGKHTSKPRGGCE